MSIAQKIRGLFGQHLLQNTAGFKVLRGNSSSGPWISDGESLALVPEGIQEIQFPVDVVGNDSIAAVVQLSVVFKYADQAGTFFNFAYSVGSSSHTGNFAEATRKALINAIVPKVVEVLSLKDIAAMVKEITFPQTSCLCEGVDIKSILLSLKPKDAQVLAALGAGKAQELIRLANTAQQETRRQAIELSAVLRTKEHNESLAATAETATLIAEEAKNELAKATSRADADAKLAEQQAQSAAAMVASFKGDPMAYALYRLATAGGDITVTSELLAAFRSPK